MFAPRRDEGSESQGARLTAFIRSSRRVQTSRGRVSGLLDFARIASPRADRSLAQASGSSGGQENPVWDLGMGREVASVFFFSRRHWRTKIAVARMANPSITSNRKPISKSSFLADSSIFLGSQPN